MLLALALAGCAGLSPDPDAGKARNFDVASYFVGRLKAWGIVEPRFGGAVRQFTVELEGRREGEDIVLDEYFLFSDGERQERHWRVRRQADGTWRGEASDVPGGALGREEGSSFSWNYDLILNVSGSSWRIAFRDWMFRIDDEVVLNRAFLSKWGIPVGEVTIAFRKLS
jgi:hypothetical protein